MQRKEIPLYVKSFINPEQNGTAVSKGQDLNPKVSCFIIKKNQVMLSLSTRDFSFIVEDNMSEIFSLLHKFKMKVDVIQNSAISFSVCADNKYNNLEKLVNELEAKFKVNYFGNVSLYTIRHATPEAVLKIENDKKVLLKQHLQDTVQLVVNE